MVMNLKSKTLLTLRVLLLLVLLICSVPSSSKRKGQKKKKPVNSRPKTQMRMCVPKDETVRARRKSCLLRPDSGPCRADILSWYYDAKQSRCYRFFWGGCQGNGNRYISHRDCVNYCFVNTTLAIAHVPYFCSLPFDFGTCFGQYNRWGWDPLFKDCRRRLYSGCGGNQNNFETRKECLATCVSPPNNTMTRFHHYTTCIPFTLGDGN